MKGWELPIQRTGGDIQTQKGKYRKKLEMQIRPGVCTEIPNTWEISKANDEAELAHGETAWPHHVPPALLQRSLALGTPLGKCHSGNSLVGGEIIHSSQLET